MGALYGQVYPDRNACNASPGIQARATGVGPTPELTKGVWEVGDKTDRLSGKMKEKTGRAVGDQDLEADGRREQAKGNVKSAGKKIKDAAKKT